MLVKKILPSSFILLIGLLLFLSCNDKKTAKYPEQVAKKIEIEEEIVEDTTSIDSIVVEHEVLPEPPSPTPPPIPFPPDPWPDSLPPEPIPEPVPLAILPKVRVPEQLIDFPDIPAEFSGGEKAMMAFISSNIQYPQEAMEMGDQGRVYVEFVVGKDGSLTGIKVLRGVSTALDREAKRMISLMPKWNPAEAKGKLARSRNRLPISFRLD